MLVEDDDDLIIVEPPAPEVITLDDDEVSSIINLETAEPNKDIVQVFITVQNTISSRNTCGKFL